MAEEAKIEDYFCENAKQLGAFVRKISWVGRRGAPDRYVAYRGRQCFVEFKASTGRLAKAQVREHKELKWHAVDVYVADTIEKCDGVIAWLKGGVDVTA